ncbi:MAG: hypothetical protein AB7U97_15095, partial [Pirellulales bacterium]
SAAGNSSAGPAARVDRLSRFVTMSSAAIETVERLGGDVAIMIQSIIAYVVENATQKVSK